ncbi:NUDIX domain-containing protein [Subsaximicrobium wynnwilliamsii]|uniref:GDP-mannose pyrophosphatase n=1 Tax=Subsaximicrobium wynnwilliamsii TaxID=291179 RepID=A0A5C6ZH65_9FLAO|nr:NUDIX domain-containing protein [Subsaximicrobium wynnwilliamsii]TXD82962.1 NUDIX domain-containing protein [Subsaximicrobium wynnwilliamsii]TXD88683.1 NUDIX domain-containing protein [Subsaximicrobium wynnwilliamsii]TXE02776.1 NUDIX domain-containing protein [Subsaximicrobium wynnwilliamsii]
MNKIKNITHTTLSKQWGTLNRIDYDYQFENGAWKRLSRESYNRGDGAAILLYNVENSTVILTKQFRMPIYENHREEGMSIEVCAGAIDHKDSPLETIIRETEEEVGYKIKNAKQVLTAYTSPGALTEKMFLFVAEYKQELKVDEGGGLASENEDIEVLELSFSKVLEMVENGDIVDAKTIMLLQYAQINTLLHS